MNLPNGTPLGPYRIVAPLGKGGMGEVYRARDTRLDRDVAIKVLSEAMLNTPEALARFEREAKAVAAISHPNILAIYDVGRDKGVPYAVTELLEGETLRQQIVVGPIPWRRAIEYSVSVSEGLAAAHARGIVHRDLKPENIFITHNGHVKILDFGLARMESPKGPVADDGATPTVTLYTTPGTVLGTVSYMSPEQIRAQTTDARSDIFSFGCVLYEMLSGKRVFEGETPADTMTAILRESPPSITATRQDVEPDLERVIDRCLEKKPDQRFQSAQDLSFTLRSLLSSGIHPPAAEPTQKKSRFPVAMVCVIVAVAAMGAAWFSGVLSSSPPEPMTNESTTAPPEHKPVESTAALPPTEHKPVESTAVQPPPQPNLPDESTELEIVTPKQPPVEKQLGLAVLPFTDLSPQPQEWFADGLTEEMISRVGAINPDRLRVIARTSAMHYKGTTQPIDQIGEDLQVDYVVEGSVRRSGDQLRITAQLIRTDTQSQVWSNTFNKTMTDIFAVQQDVAEAVADRLELKLLNKPKPGQGRKPTSVTLAYDAYLLGRHEWAKRTPESIRAAIEHFEQAIQLDSNYALAHAGLADAWGVLPYYVPGPYNDMWFKARNAAERALKLDDTLAEAHVAIANVLGHVFPVDFAGADEHYRQSIALDPNNATAHQWYGVMLAMQRRHGPAKEHLDKAIALDPLSAVMRVNYAFGMNQAKEYSEAINQASRALEFQPGMANAWRVSLRAHFGLGDIKAATRAYQELLKAEEVADLPIRLFAETAEQSGLCTALLEWIGTPEIEFTESKFRLLDRACAYAKCGEADKALNALEHAYDQQDPMLLYAFRDSRFDDLRDHPRFVNLMQRTGFQSGHEGYPNP